MGLLEFLGFKKKQTTEHYAYTQTGATPRFPKWSGNIYDCDTVQQAINAIAKEMKKLEPQHIRVKGTNKQIVDGDISRLLNEPNDYMTTSDFIEKMIWLLYLKYNCYIYPAWEAAYDKDGRLYKKYVALYPLDPMEVTYYENENGTKLGIEFLFSRNRVLKVPYKDVIHLRLNYALNEFEGGDRYGKPNNDALLKTLKINHKLLESVGKSIETSYSVNGIVKYNTMLGGEKVEAAIQKFNEQLANSESGILGLDAKSDFTAIPRNVQVVNNDTLKFIDLKILRNYGVPIEILDGTATADQKRAFIETTLEPLIVMINQQFTKCLFTQQQRNGGNRIRFYHSIMEMMTSQQQIEIANILGERGALTNNHLCEMFGIPPYEGGDIRLMSLNYVNVDIANQYQLSNAGTKVQEQPNNKPETEPTNEDKTTQDKDVEYVKKMLLKAGLSEEEANKILEEDEE